MQFSSENSEIQNHMRANNVHEIKKLIRKTINEQIQFKSIIALNESVKKRRRRPFRFISFVLASPFFFTTLSIFVCVYFLLCNINKLNKNSKE